MFDVHGKGPNATTSETTPPAAPKKRVTGKSSKGKAAKKPAKTGSGKPAKKPKAQRLKERAAKFEARIKKYEARKAQAIARYEAKIARAKKKLDDTRSKLKAATKATLTKPVAPAKKAEAKKPAKEEMPKAA